MSRNGESEDGRPGVVLEARGLTKTFGGVCAVDAVDLKVERGEAVGIVGPNGAGKTTLFNLLAGSLSPTRGKAFLNDREVTGWSPDKRCRAGLSRTFQVTLPFAEMPVLENVMIGALACGLALSAAAKEAERCLELVGLGAMRDRLASNLSTGQRKRLELARVLATTPDVVLLDEVTGGVDQASVPGLVEVVRDMHRSGVSLVIIEHNMAVIQQLAPRLVFMHQGKKIADGPTRDVAESEVVQALYLGERHASA